MAIHNREAMLLIFSVTCMLAMLVHGRKEPRRIHRGSANQKHARALNVHSKNPFQNDLDDPDLPFFPDISTTSIPSSRDCKSALNGSFGNTALSGNEITIGYNYEIKTSTDDMDDLENEILPAVRQAISDSLLSLFLEACDKAGRRLISDRKLELVGLSTRDTLVYEGVPCKELAPNDTSESSTMCNVVQGLTILHIVDQNDSYESAALSAIQDGMKGQDGLVSAHPDISELYFIEDITGYTAAPNPIQPSMETENVTSTKDFGTFPTIAVASAGALLFFLTIFGVFRHNKTKRKDMDDESLISEKLYWNRLDEQDEEVYV